MTPRRSPPPVPPLEIIERADSEQAGQRIDEGQGRVFPCEQCGADLRFHIGDQSLTCPYCGFVKEIELSTDAPIREQDFRAALRRARELREVRRSASGADEGKSDAREITCDSCGGTVHFVGTLVATECPFCGQPVQVDRAKQAEETLPVDGVLPFQVPREKAMELLRRWVKTRWFAPSAFKAAGVRGKFSGVYLPFWTYDSLTFNHYSGERGEYYYVTVGSGKNRTRQRRTRWYPASGSFQRFFDDVLVVATTALPRRLLRRLEPWPLGRCLPYDQELLAGFLARRYDVDLDEGFACAREMIERAIRAEVKRRIGGDTQRIHSIDSRYDAITFKYLLLPVWSLGYRFRGKPYQLLINAVTGEVQGTRPYSVWKILFAVLGLLAAIGGVVAITQAAG